MRTAIALFLLVLETLMPAAADPARRIHDHTAALARWADVLNRFVDDQGRIDFAGLDGDTQDLDAYTDHLAVVGPDTQPTLFPALADRIAYAINAYNALAMQGVLRAGRPQDLDSFWRRLRFFKLMKHRLGSNPSSSGRLHSSR